LAGGAEAEMMRSLQIHLLYASIVWIVAWLITALPRITATTKYWMWIATSVNFVLPLSLIPARLWPSQVSWFFPGFAMKSFGVTAPLLALWSAGAAAMAIRLSLRILRERRDAVSPAVVGLLRTRISLPEGIDRLLDPDELNAVLAHENRHARRHDNLIRLFYEVSLCILWFHPLVWLAGSRLSLYRELSCDDAVDDERALISALAKLANPDNELLLQATASSFVGDRIAYLLARPGASRLGDRLLAAVFAAALIAAAVAPISETAAAYLCALTHGATR
ncbi:MAG TPA: M56 family metallopeptidase, partial [Thermoanaerobaculia bacterium]|nr:M56 family metallopeptidase [Thermoanaerobaculia bacterium]